jgi:hypothetical protein
MNLRKANFRKEFSKKHIFVGILKAIKEKSWIRKHGPVIPVPVRFRICMKTSIVSVAVATLLTIFEWKSQE